MKRHLEHWPIAIIQDRYGGAYSGGAWLAISQANLKHKGKRRAGYVLRTENAGPHSNDVDAMVFWSEPPDWIAVGKTPAQALKNLVAGVRPKPFELRLTVSPKLKRLNARGSGSRTAGSGRSAGC